MAYATAADVAAVWRPLTPAEVNVVANLMEYAAVIIKQAVPQVDAWINDSTLDPLIPKYVSIQMVRNFLLQPIDGRKSGTRTIDDFTEGWTLADGLQSGGLILGADLLALLVPTTAASAAGAFTIRPWSHGPSATGWCG